MLTRRSFLFAGAAWAGSLALGFPWLDGVAGARAADWNRGEDEANVLQAVLARGGHIALEQNRIYLIAGKSGAKGEGWHIDKVRVRNVSYFEKVNCQGNPFIVSLRNSSISSVRCENYSFGVKFQDGCENLTVDSVEVIGGQNNNDYLGKIQGKKDSFQNRPNRNIKIAPIEARNGPYSDLYLYHSFGVQIESYLGKANGQATPLDLKNSADVLAIEADGIHFGELRACEYPHHALWLHEGSGKVTADRVVMKSSRSPYTTPVMVRQGMTLLAGTKYAGKDKKSR